MSSYREHAIVLRTYRLGETDRILHLLSPNRGKIRAVAKGVRRPGSRFGGRLEPFSLVDLQLHEGRNLDIVTQAELVRSHHAVREDWVRSACGATMVEACDKLAQEGERATGMFLLLRDGLAALDGPADHAPTSPALVLDAFLLRLAAQAGYRPQIEGCMACGGPPAAFHLGDGGMLCHRCAHPDQQRLADDVLAGLHLLLEAPWHTVVAAGPPSRTLGTLVHSYFRHHLATDLKAWELVPR